MKYEKQIQAKKLRKKGYSIREIAKTLKVSKSSVSLWVRDVALSNKQKETLLARNPIINNQLLGAQTRKLKAKQRREIYQQEGMIEAKKQNVLHASGCMLYWAEGSKSRCDLKIVNTDKHLLKLFVDFLRQTFYITDDRIKLSIRYYDNNGLNTEDIKTYWMDALDVPETCIFSTSVSTQPRSASGKPGPKKHPYGICSLRITRGIRILQHIYGAIKYYAKINTSFYVD